MSNSKKDPDYALNIERAIVDKYGIETVQHPAKNWSPQKEQEYIEQLKLLREKAQ